jgi:hypothetical protein
MERGESRIISGRNHLDHKEYKENIELLNLQKALIESQRREIEDVKKGINLAFKQLSPKEQGIMARIENNAVLDFLVPLLEKSERPMIEDLKSLRQLGASYGNNRLDELIILAQGDDNPNGGGGVPKFNFKSVNDADMGDDADKGISR